MIGLSKRYGTSTNNYPNTWLHIGKPPKLCRQQSLIKVTIVEVELSVEGELRIGGGGVLQCWFAEGDGFKLANRVREKSQ